MNIIGKTGYTLVRGSTLAFSRHVKDQFCRHFTYPHLERQKLEPIMAREVNAGVILGNREIAMIGLRRRRRENFVLFRTRVYAIRTSLTDRKTVTTVIALKQSAWEILRRKKHLSAYLGTQWALEI